MSKRIDINIDRLEDLLILEHRPESSEDYVDYHIGLDHGWNDYRQEMIELIARLRDGG